MISSASTRGMWLQGSLRNTVNGFGHHGQGETRC
jgi:hypothetical protein